ncbi:Elicitor peptide 2 like [Actinidia chinensis var. chinensis]|uniref:Elicitor peptide 2 like n=1 Tax=Actinidia chinensis var. chinensis TaxID=1590841 RepID=A0A2R6PQK0_ACTCC|nr:Elicitor peptide 2 like [Actinidia chinensis var. chinensis]
MKSLSFHTLPAASQGKLTEDATTNKNVQNFVTCVYQAKVSGLCRNVTVTWLKNLMSHTLNVFVENPCGEDHYTFKIDLKTWQFWGKKGLKSFKVDGKLVDVFWDFRTAKLSSSPEPCSDYYVAIVSDEEVVLLLGDQKNEAFKRTKSRPSLVDSVLLHKKESVFGKKYFCSRTRLGHGRREHDILIETSLSGPSDPEMWISVDGVLLIRVGNLHWRFRGNESVSVENQPVQIFWDVHDWLYSDPNSGQGIFVFKHGESEDNGGGEGRSLCDEDCGDNKEFCHLLYAWKVE